MDDSKRKRIQDNELELLKILDKICRENNIRYSLAFGSVLGAVRHGGFIPWDDDADVVMEYNQYKKFSKLCKDYFGTDYFLQDSDTERETPFVFAKIRKNKTKMPEKSTQDLNINQGIWVDIFFLVNACKSSFGLKIQNALIQIYQSLKCRYRYLNNKKVYSVSAFKKIIYNIPNPIYRLIEKFVFFLIRTIGSKKSDKYYNMSNDGLDISIVPKSWFDDTVARKFEDTELSIPKEWDEYLTFLYGDYMKPVDKVQ
ncbi:MAG: LicD family protein [Eubacteriales bacterium]|nr:LicD family protein [Eubacteriales bacterium]